MIVDGIRKLFSQISFSDQSGQSFLTQNILGQRGTRQNFTGVNVTEFTANNFAAVFNAVSIIAGTIAHLPLVVFEKSPLGKMPAETHPVYNLLRYSPNDRMSASVFRETMQSHLLNWGNCYAEIERNGRGDVVGLWPLPPDRIKPTIIGNDIRYLISIGGKEQELFKEDVFHIPGLGYDGVVGYGIITLARNSIGLGLSTEEFGAKFFSQGSNSGGVLSYPGRLSDEAKKNVKTSWEEKKSGLENAHQIKVLEEGMKFIPTTIPPNDSQFLETRAFQITEIARWFNIPPHLLKDLSRSSFSNIEQQSIEFLIHTMQIWFAKWEQEIYRKLFRPEEQGRFFAKFNTNALLRGDNVARMQFYKGAINDGWMSRNEVRDLEDRNAEPGLDEFLTPLNMQGANGSNEDQNTNNGGNQNG